MDSRLIIFLLLLASNIGRAQPVIPGRDPRWQTDGVGPLANRPTCPGGAQANRSVYICLGTGCTTGSAIHYCTASGWQIQSGSGGGTPGSPSFSYQFNNGAFGGASPFLYTPSTQTNTFSPSSNLPNGLAGAYAQSIQSASTNQLWQTDPLGPLGTGTPIAIFNDFTMSGLFSPQAQANFIGTDLGCNFINGRNRDDNADKTTEICSNFNAIFSAAGQRDALFIGTAFNAPGDSRNININGYYQNAYVTAFGDEGIDSIGNVLIEDWNRLYLITTGAPVISGCPNPMTFSNNTSSGGSITFQVNSTSGCTVGDWLTGSPGAWESGDTNEEVFQVTAIGAGPCPGVACTLTALLVSPHTAADQIKPAQGIPIPTQGGTAGISHMGVRNWVADLSQTPIFNLSSYDFNTNHVVTATSGPSWGSAGGGGPLSGGTTNAPGCLVFAQDGWPVFNSPTPAITAGQNQLNPAVTVTHGLTVGTTVSVQLKGFTGGWASTANNQIYFATATDSTHLTINQLDSTSLGAVAGSPVVVTNVMASYIPIQSIGSSTTLTTMRGYTNTPTSAKGASVRSAIYACGRVNILVPTYNVGPPPTETVSLIELENTGFPFASGDKLEVTISPFNAAVSLMKSTWQGIGPHGSVPTYWYAANLGLQSANGLINVAQSPNLDPTCSGGSCSGGTGPGYKFGINFQSSVGIDFINLGGPNVGSTTAITLSTFSNEGFQNLGDPKCLHWTGPGSALICGNSNATSFGGVTGDLTLGSHSKGFLLTDNDMIAVARIDASGVAGGVPTFTLPSTSSGGTHTICTTDTCPTPIQDTRNLPDATTNNTVNIGSWASANQGAISGMICVYDSTSGNRPCKTYSAPLCNGSSLSNTIVNPISGIPVSGTIDFNLIAACSVGGASVDLKVENLGPSGHSGIVYFSLLFGGQAPAFSTFTPSTTQSNISTPTTFLGVLSQIGSQVLMPGGKTVFASLGTVPVSGTFIYCTDCTTAATCAGSGSGHMAVSNGTNWTCQ